MELNKINKYNNTTFYKVVCKDKSVAQVFVGHTTDLVKRVGMLAVECSNPKCTAYNTAINQFIRAHGDWDNFEVEPIEQVSCSNLTEVLKRKKEHVISCKDNLNVVVPSRTLKEWNVDNKDHIAATHLEYYVNNYDHVAGVHHEYYQKNKERLNVKHKCECGGHYTFSNKLCHEKTQKHQDFIKA